VAATAASTYVAEVTTRPQASRVIQITKLCGFNPAVASPIRHRL